MGHFKVKPQAGTWRDGGEAGEAGEGEREGTQGCGFFPSQAREGLG